MADNVYSFKPEDYDDIKTNHPQLYKNRSSGKAPNLELVNKETEGGGSSGFTVWIAKSATIDETDPENPLVSYSYKRYAEEPTIVYGTKNLNGEFECTWNGTEVVANDDVATAYKNGEDVRFVLCWQNTKYDEEKEEVVPDGTKKFLYRITGFQENPDTGDSYYTSVASSYNPHASTLNAYAVCFSTRGSGWNYFGD